MADTKRDIQQKLKTQSAEIENLAVQHMAGRLSEADFITASTTLSAAIETEIAALAAAAP